MRTGRVFAPTLILLLAGCSGGAAAPSASGTTSAPGGGSLTVYAAASLGPVLARVKDAYEAANPGTTLTISTDSSSALETKIEQNAPSDLFLSADTTNPQKLEDQGLASGSIVRFAGNLLTIIVPSANPAGIRSPSDLAKRGVKIIAAGDAVPITKYATQLVANLGRESGYPANFAEAYAVNVVSKEDNVAAVVSKVELGEGDAGIVYATDAKTSTKVKTIAVPVSANVPATYGGVVVMASPNKSVASAFLTWLAGTDGQAIFASFGFLPAS